MVSCCKIKNRVPNQASRFGGRDWKAELEVIRDFEFEPKLAGMTLLGITTATEIFDEISIKVKEPNTK